jgi:hypothetical protein
MSIYAFTKDNKITEYPVYEGEIRLRVTNISWPPNGFQPPMGYVEVLMTEMPDIDYTQNITEGAPEFRGNSWHQVWIVSGASQSEVTERIASQWANVRDQRNSLLQATDWTQLPDSPADKTAYEVYRQQLRDVTTQSDPFNLVWPVKP